MSSNREQNHAIAIGGGMAGLLAARILADHYKEVTLVERDVFPPEGEQRRGVPQGRHTHGLLASGRRVLPPGFLPRRPPRSVGSPRPGKHHHGSEESLAEGSF